MKPLFTTLSVLAATSLPIVFVGASTAPVLKANLHHLSDSYQHAQQEKQENSQEDSSSADYSYFAPYREGDKNPIPAGGTVSLSCDTYFPGSYENTFHIKSPYGNDIAGGAIGSQNHGYAVHVDKKTITVHVPSNAKKLNGYSVEVFSRSGYCKMFFRVVPSPVP